MSTSIKNQVINNQPPDILMINLNYSRSLSGCTYVLITCKQQQRSTDKMKIRSLLAVCPTNYCDNVDDGKHEWLPLVEVLFATSASSPVSTTSQKLGLDFRRNCQRQLSIWNCRCVGDEDNNLIFKFQFCPPMKPGSILTSSCNFFFSRIRCTQYSFF